MKKIISLLILSISILVSAQVENGLNELNIKGKIDSVKTNSKSPLKAALYSAILPGAGQFYNKKLWKIPLVWGALGTGAGIALFYNDRYNTFRNAYIASLNGEPHEFSDVNGYTTEILATAQDDQRRNRDYAIVITSVLYILNILEALVDAHLSDIDNDPDLSFSPVIINNPATFTQTAGIGIQYNF